MGGSRGSLRAAGARRSLSRSSPRRDMPEGSPRRLVQSLQSSLTGREHDKSCAARNASQHSVALCEDAGTDMMQRGPIWPCVTRRYAELNSMLSGMSYQAWTSNFSADFLGTVDLSKVRRAGDSRAGATLCDLSCCWHDPLYCEMFAAARRPSRAMRSSAQ